MFNPRTGARRQITRTLVVSVLITLAFIALRDRVFA